MKQFGHIDWSSLGPLRKSLKDPDTGNSITQAQVARVAACSQAYIARIEKGQDMRSPNEDIVNGIALALRMPLESLLESLDKKNTAKPVEERPNIVQLARESTPQLIPLFKQLYQPKGFAHDDGTLKAEPEHIPCPPFLENVEGAYGIVMPDLSMSSRYREGDTLFVNTEIAPFYRDDVVVELKFNDQIICVVREVVSLKEPPDRNEGGTYQYGLMPYLKRQALEGYLRYEKEIDDLVEIDAVLEQHCEWYPLVLDGYGNTQTNYESNEPAISMYPIVGTEKYRHGFCRIQKQYDAKSIIASASAAVVKSEPDDQKKPNNK